MTDHGILLLNIAHTHNMDSFGILINSVAETTLIYEGLKHPIELEFLWI
jgi:hypothetical protein